MRTPIQLTISALFLTLSLLISLPGISQDEYYTEKTFSATMYPAKAESKLWLCLEQYKPEEKITLQLVDQKGKVLFNETLWGQRERRTTYRQKFDMSQLGDGKYTFRLSTDTHRQEFAFDLSTPALQQTQPTRLIAIR